MATTSVFDAAIQPGAWLHRDKLDGERFRMKPNVKYFSQQLHGLLLKRCFNPVRINDRFQADHLEQTELWRSQVESRQF